VVNHFSEDETLAGLKHLQLYWGDRLKIINYPNLTFDQETITNCAINIAYESNPDWIYVFDADEFLVLDPNISLHQILKNCDSDVRSIRYELDNYISTSNFNSCYLCDYLKLRYKSLPTIHNASSQSKYEDMYHGRTTFFDYPFGFKIIFRVTEESWIGTGSHGLVGLPPIGREIVDNRIGCAHLTFPTRSIMERKARHGEDVIKLGFPKYFAWQAQVIYQLSKKNKLNWFWDRHSLPETVEKEGQGNLTYEIDNQFINYLRPTISLLESHFKSNDISKIDGVNLGRSLYEDSFISIETMVSLAARKQKIIVRIINGYLNYKRVNGLAKSKENTKSIPSRSSINHDLLALIPTDAKRIVEVGCMLGTLAQAYREVNPNCHYIGIDLDSDNANKAKIHCNQTITADIESIDDVTWSQLATADCWIFGDTLQHLRNPWEVLARINKSMKVNGGGTLVVCVRNAQYWGIQIRLNSGGFRYDDSILQEYADLRWFTRTSLIELFNTAGFKMTKGTVRFPQKNAPGKIMQAIGALAEASGTNVKQALEDAKVFQYVMQVKA
jgi:2-polyprenyl-3-methyl-5-hydroxy-6-metoxy-1,4-benzoquinol methylase